MTGSLARLAAPLGLMLDYSGHDRTRNAVIDGPSEDWDREERRLLTSYIMMMDFISSTTSGWGTAVILDEIVSETRLLWLTHRCHGCLQRGRTLSEA